MRRYQAELSLQYTLGENHVWFVSFLNRLLHLSSAEVIQALSISSWCLSCGDLVEGDIGFYSTALKSSNVRRSGSKKHDYKENCQYQKHILLYLYFIKYLPYYMLYET